MNKSTLNRFIQKYNLSGNAEQVKWSFKGDKTLSTRFITGDKSLLGSVKLGQVDFDDVDLGVYDTATLKSLLAVLDDDIDISLTKLDEKAINMVVKNNSNSGVSVNYTLSDLSVIPDAPSLKKVPHFGTEINITTDVIDKFIKGKSALQDTERFTIVNKDGQCSLVIGYSATNTNRVSIPVSTTTCELVDNVSFNADLFKEVLVANRECRTATLKVANEGLSKIVFNVDNFESEYFMVSMEDVD